MIGAKLHFKPIIGRSLRTGHYSSVVDQLVNLAITGIDALRKRADRFSGAQLKRLNRNRLARRCLDLIDRCLALGLGARCDRHLSTLGRHRPRRFGAQPRCSASDQNRFAGQVDPV